ncbi:MAG: hypothetical protein KXJ61_04525 [Hydrogenophaga sp.]|jgi:hypothetical protein|uniref:hypothetical protein n=1 Tax=Hydrogenophaga sp. TaxID=1904254 RepID=UPI001DF74CDF|nr:hypothetical protein [Hydrogenophaga sp.]MBW0169473.1 hypothetical protein [Hydrogenophaga sp.]MBW0182921.1 hypothetical protein [Hydrogenophaga sp.]
MDVATMTDPRAAHLLGLWSRLSAQHVTLGSGCGCGVGGVSVSLQDFELDIADYLWAESERLGEKAVEAFLLQPGPINEQRQPVMHLLTRLEEGEAGEAVADWLLTRLARTLESFAKLHGPMGEMS